MLPYCTFVYAMPVGKTWNKNNTGSLTIRRVHAIAQDDLEGIDAERGYADTGSYVKGGTWGGPNSLLVKLLTPSGDVPWDELGGSKTANAGSFPGPPQVTYSITNRFFWEEFILGLRTKP